MYHGWFPFWHFRNWGNAYYFLNFYFFFFVFSLFILLFLKGNFPPSFKCRSLFWSASVCMCVCQVFVISHHLPKLKLLYCAFFFALMNFCSEGWQRQMYIHILWKNFYGCTKKVIIVITPEFTIQVRCNITKWDLWSVFSLDLVIK